MSVLFEEKIIIDKSAYFEKFTCLVTHCKSHERLVRIRYVLSGSHIEHIEINHVSAWHSAIRVPVSETLIPKTGSIIYDIPPFFCLLTTLPFRLTAATNMRYSL